MMPRDESRDPAAGASAFLAAVRPTRQVEGPALPEEEAPKEPEPRRGRQEGGDAEETRGIDSDGLSQTSRVRVLSTMIDQSILRGVTICEVLHNFGASFRKHAFNQEDYVKSTHTACLDAFISHDWSSGWAGKTLALCLIYNGWPAAIGSGAVAILLLILQCHLWPPALPAPMPEGRYSSGPSNYYGYWAEIICPVVFAIIFCYWQDIRVMLRLKSDLASLDKYCIDQEDAERKAAGILGLGGFLRHTDRFVICWTPRYFTRLWCTYEVASWLYLEKPLSSIEFLPLCHAKSVVTVGCGVCLVCGLYALSMVFVGGRWYIYFVVGYWLCVSLPAMHWLRRQIHDIRKLPEQLKSFSITNAGCFCCANNHEMPGKVQVKLPCDREIVYETVASWFQGEGESRHTRSLDDVDDGELRHFDEKIRDIFGPWLLASAGPTQLPYNYLVLCGWPYIFRSCDVLAALGAADTRTICRIVFIEYVTIVFALVPLNYKLTLFFVSWADHMVGIPLCRAADLLTTVACIVPAIAVMLVMWLPMTAANTYLETWVPAALWALMDLVVTMAVFRKDLWRLAVHRPARRLHEGAQEVREATLARLHAQSSGTCSGATTNGMRTASENHRSVRSNRTVSFREDVVGEGGNGEGLQEAVRFRETDVDLQACVGLGRKDSDALSI